MNFADFLLLKIKNAILKWESYLCYKRYVSEHKASLALLKYENKKAEGEDDFIKRWSVLSPRIDVYAYRFYSHYCGCNPNIVPDDIGHSVIEKFLNPPEYRPAYADKNLFPLIIGKDHVPRTVVCRVNGGVLLDGDFAKADKPLSEYIGDAQALILKPSVESHSGMRVMKFVRKDGSFISHDCKITLTEDFLLSYHKNFCLQEAVIQHPFMSKLCPTSVNTIRLCLYRSVKDNQPVVPAGLIRIGKEGAVVDNSGAGGMFVGVDVESGELGKYLIDQYGNRQTTWNGIDFAKENLVVPNWDKVMDFAKYISTRIIHHRLIALDISLGADGNPILIEYNINFFGYGLYMFTNQEVFGNHLDEVIAYCRKRL